LVRWACLPRARPHALEAGAAAVAAALDQADFLSVVSLPSTPRKDSTRPAVRSAQPCKKGVRCGAGGVGLCLMVKTEKRTVKMVHGRRPRNTLRTDCYLFVLSFNSEHSHLMWFQLIGMDMRYVERHGHNLFLDIVRSISKYEALLHTEYICRSIRSNHSVHFV
jgi:hypothetical protein